MSLKKGCSIQSPKHLTTKMKFSLQNVEIESLSRDTCNINLTVTGQLAVNPVHPIQHLDNYGIIFNNTFKVYRDILRQVFHRFQFKNILKKLYQKHYVRI